MSDRADASVVLLDWFGEAEKAIQDVEWKLEDRDDSTNRLYVTTSLAEADGVKTEQELVYRQRRFSIVDIDRDRDADKAVIEADEVQAELADLILVEFKPNSWTLEQAVTAALAGTQWTIGDLVGARYGRAEFEDISVLDALKFLARHQDARLSFDSLRRRVSITPNAGTGHEVVFTYGRQLANIEKTESAPTTTVIYPTGAEGMTVASVNDGVPYVEDYGYYTAQGISLSEARDRFRKEDYWADERYTVAENMLRDAQARLAVEAYPQISYTLTAQATTAVDGQDDFDLATLHLGDQVYVWDQEIDAKIRAEVTAVTTSSDASENELVLSYLPPSLGAGVEGRFFGDSGRPSDGPNGRPLARSVPQPRPSMPILEAINDLGTAVIRWNGQDHEGSFETIPEQFGEVQAFAAPLVDGVIPSPTGPTVFQDGATGRRAGGTMPVSFGRPGEYAVWFQMVGRDGQTRSEFSEPLVVEVPEFVDTSAIEAELEDARARLAAAEAEARQALDEAGQVRDEWAVEYPRLQAEIQDAQTAVADAEVRLEQTRLGMENLRDVRLPELQNALNTGLQDAQQWREVGAISASSLRVGDWENLLSEDYIWELRDDGLSSPLWRANTGGAAGWTTITDQGGIPILVRYAAPSSPSLSRLAFTAGGKGVPVRPGDEFFLSCDGWRSTSAPFGSIQLQVRYGDESLGFVQRVTVGDFYTNGIPDGISWRVPDNASIRRMQLEFTAHPNATGNAHFGDFVFRRKNTGNMIVDGAIFARHLAVESVSAAVAEFLSLSAQDATVQNLAARIATLIELNASRITTGQLGAARINVADLYSNTAFINNLRAAVVTALQLTAERGFIGGALLEDDSITVAKLSVTEQMTAQLFQAMEARIGDLAFNTAAGMNIDAGRITTGSLTGRTVQTSSTWASTGGAVMRENGSQGNFVAVNDAGQTVARLGGARNEMANLSLVGDLRVGVGSSVEGGLAPDGSRIRLLGRNPWGVAGHEDMYSYGGSGVFEITHQTSSELRTWDVFYESVAPYGNRSPLLGVDNEAGMHRTMLTYHTIVMRADMFQIRIRSQAQFGDTIRFRMRYLAVWR